MAGRLVISVGSPKIKKSIVSAGQPGGCNSDKLQFQVFSTMKGRVFYGMTNKDNPICALRKSIEEYDLKEYDSLAFPLEQTCKQEDLGEMHLCRAHLKMLISDVTFEEDLLSAESLLPEGSRYPPLFEGLAPQSPNGFILFYNQENSLPRFLDALERLERKTEKYCGSFGLHMNRQLQSEILYYMGEVQRAGAIASVVRSYALKRGEDALAVMAGYSLLRCNLVIGNIGDTEEEIMRIFRCIKRAPHSRHAKMYETMRDWLNLTTGWSGDTPRYYQSPDGTMLPIFEDRIIAIQKGISTLGPTEKPLEE